MISLSKTNDRVLESLKQDTLERSKMSERSPRLRALRPRPQQQQQAKSETSPRRAEVRNKDVKDEEEVLDETSSPTNRRSKDQESESNSGSEHSPRESVPKSLTKKDVKDEDIQEDDDKQYECKMCKPPKKYATLKLYMQHLKNEHDNMKPKVIILICFYKINCSFSSIDYNVRISNPCLLTVEDFLNSFLFYEFVL